MVGFVVAFECVCRNPVGYLGFFGFTWFFGFKWVKWVICFSDLSILAFLCVCAYGYKGRKV